MAKKRIIIVGGGFGGVKCAQTLARELSKDEAEIILFDRRNHLVFSPLQDPPGTLVVDKTSPIVIALLQADQRQFGIQD